MIQNRHMTDEEKVDTAYQAALLRRAGDEEGYSRLISTVPLPPYIAKAIKETVGTEVFTRYDWNLAEVEAEFGPDFINT